MSRSKENLRVILFLLVLAAGLFCRSAVVYVQAEDNEVHLEKVHSIYWRAVLRKDLKSGKKVLAKKGSTVTVTCRSYTRGGRSIITYGSSGQRATVPNSWLSYKSDLTTIVQEGDYNTATKEAYINKRTHVCKGEKYLIWVSLDKQRVNVFTASENRWVLHRVFPCSTGNVNTPTRGGWHRVDYKRTWVMGMKWFTEVVGGGIHRWPGKFNRTLFGKHVVSKGCIRLTEKDAHELYKMIPVKTRVLVY